MHQRRDHGGRQTSQVGKLNSACIKWFSGFAHGKSVSLCTVLICFALCFWRVVYSVDGFSTQLGGKSARRHRSGLAEDHQDPRTPSCGPGWILDRRRGFPSVEWWFMGNHLQMAVWQQQASGWWICKIQPETLARVKWYRLPPNWMVKNTENDTANLWFHSEPPATGFGDPQ